MYFTVYRITNNLNGKFYIGKHQTKNLEDGYFGSGKRLRLAINKYGIDSFQKEILFVFDNEEDMNQKEKELVILSEMSYNMCPGGKGGFSYINKTKIVKFKGRKHSEETKRKISEMRTGKTHYIPSEEQKARMSETIRKKHLLNPGFNKKK